MDQVAASVRIVEDIYRLDVLGCLADKSGTCAIAELVSDGMVGKSGFKFDAATGQLTPEPAKSTHPEFHIICSGQLENLIGLNRVIVSHEITYNIEHPMSPQRGLDSEPGRVFSPFRAQGTFIVLVRLPAQLPSHLSQFPDVYLLTPELAKSLQEIALNPLGTIQANMSEVVENGGSIDQLNFSPKQSSFLQILRIKSLLKKHSIADDSLYTYIVSTNSDILTSVSILMLACQKDSSAASGFLKAVAEKLGSPGNPEFDATLAGFIAAESMHKLPREDASLIRAKLTPYLKNDKMDQSTKALISSLTN